MMEDNRVLTEIHKLDKKIDVLTERVEGTFNTRLKEHDNRINKLETNQRWVVLGIVAAVIGELLKTVLK